MKVADRWCVRAIAVACVALLGCDDRTTVDPTIVQHDVLDKVWPVPEVTRVDIVYVVDRSPALAPYREALARELGFAGAGFVTQPGYNDLHIGVVTADLGNDRDAAAAMPGQCAGWGDGGALQHSSLVDGSFITVRQTPAAVHTNVRGSLAAALPALADLDAVGCDRTQPLEAMRIALDDNPHNAGFLRSDAYLFVIIVSAQRDDSPRSLDAYAAFLHGLKSQLHEPFVFEASDDPRLRAFSRLFPNHSETLSIANAQLYSLSDTWDWLHPFGPTPGGSPCFDRDLLDTDPAADGVQPDCVVTERTRSGEALLPACTDGAGVPCWRVWANPQDCGPSQPFEVSVERGDLEPPEGAVDEAQCVPS